VASYQSFLVFSAHAVPCVTGEKKWRLTSRFGQESFAASAGTVNFAMDSDAKDVVLTGVGSVESAELKVVKNGNM